MKRPWMAGATLLVFAVSLAGCAGHWMTFGAPVSKTSPLPVSEILATPESYDGKKVVVSGTVAEVCQTKGCWMTMVTGDRVMRVRFKDYAFFVPKDCSGKAAVVEGVFTREMVPVAEARHYLEDAGKHEEAQAITEPVPSFTFLASGVRLSK